MHVCGFNSFGQLERLIVSEENQTPTSIRCFQPSPKKQVTHLAFAWNHVVLVERGSVFINGFIGKRRETMYRLEQVPFACADIHQVACSQEKMFCVTTDGQAWEYNYASMGWRNLKPLLPLSEVEGLELKVVKFAVGATMVAVLMDDGRAYTLPNELLPVPSEFGSVLDLDCGHEHGILLTSTGQVMTWGTALRGQLGNDNVDTSPMPAEVHALAGIKCVSIAAGGWCSCAISSDGDLYTWGWNKFGQLGHPRPQDNLDTGISVAYLPVVVDFALEAAMVKSVFCGTGHTIVILRALYKRGDLVFTGDGNTLISPVGNRITLFDLKNNKSRSLHVESRFNFTTLAVSPDSTVLVAVNDQGDAHLISLISRSLIFRYHFKYPIGCVKFSPDGMYVAFAKGRTVNVFKAPGKFLGEYNPFVLEKVFHGAFDDVTCIDWTSDSAHLIVGSKDTTARVYSMKKSRQFRICKFSGHGDVIVGVYFEENSLNAWSISANGRIDQWEANMELSDIIDFREEPSQAKKKCANDEEEDEIDLLRGELRDSKLEEVNEEEDSDEEETKNIHLRYTLNVKKYVKTDAAKITTVSFHKKSKIMVYGREDGAFFLYELPEVNLIHSLSIADTSISNISFNSTGDWIGLGCEDHGQLLVWEWQSESYILKQQGHSAAISCLEYSGDGQFIATGGEDGKVKLWNTTTGFCFVTFKDHSSGVTAVKFARNRKFVVSASVDGTVRAFDLMRYRNFKTLTTPRPVQFASLAIDSSCEFVAAGGQDVFEVYLWSMKVGRLMEVLAGHEGPVVSLDFNPGLTSTELVSASWDKTVRIWNAIDSSLSNEVVRLGADCLAVTYRPDGKEFAVATLDCQISFFDPATARQTGYVDGKNDLASGRSDTDLITAKKSQRGKAFTSICYSADGGFIIAGGHTKYVCIYSRTEELIIKKYEVTQNRSLDAVDDFINRRKMTESGNLDSVEMRDVGKNKIRLPGAKKTDMAARSFKPEIKVFALQFSPTNHSWAVASTEGLLIYSLDAGTLFDPYMLDESITPATIRIAKKEKRHSDAIMMSLRLNEKPLIKEVLENMLVPDIEICASTLPEVYVEKLLEYIAGAIESSKFIEFYLIWVKHLIVRTRSPPQNILLSLQKAIQKKYQDLSKLAYFNKYSIMLIKKIGASASEDVESEDEDGLEMSM